nr:zinc finger, CCHC-type [Tanacetum cinerariifolium]
ELLNLKPSPVNATSQKTNKAADTSVRNSDAGSKEENGIPPAVVPTGTSEEKQVAADPLGDVGSKVQQEIGKEFAAMMTSGTVRATEAATLALAGPTTCMGYLEDASFKKFLVSNFMNYKMVDNRPLMEQFHEMLRIMGHPEWHEDETLKTTRKRMKWENDDYICHGHILNDMSDSLFDIYQNIGSTKELWESLESKYMAEDASSKNNYMNYKMVDTKPVMEQFHEMLRILGQYVQHNLMMDEAISVAVIIDKLPPSWKDFKHSLKHKKKELNLVQLGSHIRIEEGLRNQKLDNNPKGKNQIGSSSVNTVKGD